MFITDRLRNRAWLYLGSVDLVFGYLACMALKGTSRDRYLFSWSVIRYLDCIIDSTADREQKIQSLDSIKHLITDIQNNRVNYERLEENEKYLFHYIKLEEQSVVKTIDNFVDILNSFEIDISRKGKIMPWNEYDRFLFYRSDSVSEFYFRLFFNSNESWIKELAHHYGRSTQYGDDVLDLPEDISYGQINITTEEIKLFGIKDVMRLTEEEKTQFANYRKTLIVDHYEKFFEIVEQHVGNFFKKQYLKASIAYNVSSIVNNNFYPGNSNQLPFEKMVVKLTKIRNQVLLSKFLYHFIYCYTLPNWNMMRGFRRKVDS